MIIMVIITTPGGFSRTESCRILQIRTSRFWWRTILWTTGWRRISISTWARTSKSTIYRPLATVKCTITLRTNTKMAFLTSQGRLRQVRNISSKVKAPPTRRKLAEIYPRSTSMSPMHQMWGSPIREWPLEIQGRRRWTNIEGSQLSNLHNKSNRGFTQRTWAILQP